MLNIVLKRKQKVHQKHKQVTSLKLSFSYVYTWIYFFYITPRVKCGFTHAAGAEIRIFTPLDIKFRKILVRKTFFWRVWLHHSPSAGAANSHSLEQVLSHSYRNGLFYFWLITHILLVTRFFMFYLSIQSIYAEVMFNSMVNFFLAWNVFCDFHMHNFAVERRTKICILGS